MQHYAELERGVFTTPMDHVGTVQTLNQSSQWGNVFAMSCHVLQCTARVHHAWHLQASGANFLTMKDVLA